MARPRKQTVDYFPHVVVSGKTMFVLEAQFGNDGYAFWFKLLELLGSTDGHVYDCRNPADWQFLLAKTRVDEDKARKILELLSNLHAIDVELWENNVIWCQNFVDNITDAYKNRRAKPPEKPDVSSFYSEKPTREGVSTDRNFQISESDGVSTDRNPQTKLNETKLNETKSNNNKQPVIKHPMIDEGFAEVCKYYKENIGRFTPAIGETLGHMVDENSAELVKHALHIAVMNNATSEIKYAEKTLQNWKSSNLLSIVDVQREEKKFQSSKNLNENTPEWFKEYQPNKGAPELNASQEEIEAERQRLLAELRNK